VRSQIRRQLQAREVCLEQKECFEFNVGTVEFNRHAVIDTTKQGVFMSADGYGLNSTEGDTTSGRPLSFVCSFNDSVYTSSVYTSTVTPGFYVNKGHPGDEFWD
jgi:hypothetical protein